MESNDDDSEEDGSDEGEEQHIIEMDVTPRGEHWDCESILRYHDYCLPFLLPSSGSASSALTRHCTTIQRE